MLDANAADLKDESGWKLVAGDVFRSPTNAMALCVHVGSGVQIISTAVVTLALASLGFLSPASRGALVTTTMVRCQPPLECGFVTLFVAVTLSKIIPRRLQRR